MQFLIDNLTAVVVSSVVLLILAAITTSTQQGAIDAVQVDARFNSVSSLSEILESDFPNIGAGVPAGETRIHEYSDGIVTTAFEFSGIVGAAPADSVERVRYELDLTGTAVIGEGATQQTVPTYRIRRMLHDGTAFQVSGQSHETVTEFRIRLLDATRTPVSVDLDAARVAEVSIAAAAPIGQTSSFSVSRWQRRFQLNNLYID